MPLTPNFVTNGQSSVSEGGIPVFAATFTKAVNWIIKFDETFTGQIMIPTWLEGPLKEIFIKNDGPDPCVIWPYNWLPNSGPSSAPYIVLQKDEFIHVAGAPSDSFWARWQYDNAGSGIPGELYARASATLPPTPVPPTPTAPTSRIKIFVAML